MPEPRRDGERVGSDDTNLAPQAGDDRGPGPAGIVDGRHGDKGQVACVEDAVLLAHGSLDDAPRLAHRVKILLHRSLARVPAMSDKSPWSFYLGFVGSHELSRCGMNDPKSRQTLPLEFVPQNFQLVRIFHPATWLVGWLFHEAKLALRCGYEEHRMCVSGYRVHLLETPKESRGATKAEA